MVFTRLPCRSEYAYVVKLGKLLNQNLIIKTVKNDEQYFRLTALESQTGQFVASVGRFLRNNPLSSKSAHTSRVLASVKLEQPKNGSVRPCIVHLTVH